MTIIESHLINIITAQIENITEAVRHSDSKEIVKIQGTAMEIFRSLEDGHPAKKIFHSIADLTQTIYIDKEGAFDHLRGGDQ